MSATPRHSSCASSTVRSRVEALRLQIEEERNQRVRVEQKIRDVASGTSQEMTIFPIKAALAALPRDSSVVADFVRQSDPAFEASSNKSSSARLFAKQESRVAQPSNQCRKPTVARVRVPSPPRKPALPEVARGSKRNDARSGYSLVGRRRPTESELYVATMRHEDRMKQVRQFSLDV